MSFPREVYQEICKYVSLADQAAFRRVNRMFRDLPIDEKHYCIEPSEFEIAKWLYHQSQLLSSPETIDSSVYGKWDDIIEYRVGLDYRKTITLNSKTGELLGIDRDCTQTLSKPAVEVIKHKNITNVLIENFRKHTMTITMMIMTIIKIMI